MMMMMMEMIMPDSIGARPGMRCFLPHFLLTFLSLFHISNGNSNDKDVLEDDYDDDLSIL